MAQTPRGKGKKQYCGAKRPKGGSAYLVAFCFAWAATQVTPAQAYRPFDGTDAAVVDEHEFELELGPLQYEREGPAKFLIAPAVVGNYGLPGGREIVLEGKVFWPIGGNEENSRTNLARGRVVH